MVSSASQIAAISRPMLSAVVALHKNRLTRTSLVENDASAKAQNPRPRITLTFHLLTSKVDRFLPLPRGPFLYQLIGSVISLVTDKRTDGRTDGRRDGRTNGQTDGRINGQTDGQTDGRTDGQTDGQFDNIMPPPASLARLRHKTPSTSTGWPKKSDNLFSDETAEMTLKVDQGHWR